jgi:DNA polymerase III epsilon subunit-like protein
MKHHNFHMPVVVDVETTGDKAGYHDLIQIAVLPLDDEFNPSKEHEYFEMKLRPVHGNIDPIASEVHRLDMAKIMSEGVDADDAVDFFVRWYNRLDLPLNRRLMPIASNYVFDQGFVSAWLGHKLFNERFYYHYRDTQSVALYLNDRAAMMNELIPYPAVGLNEIANRHGIENLKKHDALQDCITTAASYKAMCTEWTPVYPRETRTLKEPTKRWFEMNKFELQGQAWIRPISESKGVARVGEKWFICDADKFIELPECLTPEDILRFFL